MRDRAPEAGPQRRGDRNCFILRSTLFLITAQLQEMNSLLSVAKKPIIGRVYRSAECTSNRKGCRHELLFDEGGKSKSHAFAFRRISSPAKIFHFSRLLPS